MILRDLVTDRASFAQRTGWDAKPQGMCRGEVCVPAPGALREDGRVDVAVAAERPDAAGLVLHERHAQALGPSTVGRALATAEAADPLLEDRDGNPFRLSALHGRKVLLVAWASW